MRPVTLAMNKTMHTHKIKVVEIHKLGTLPSFNLGAPTQTAPLPPTELAPAGSLHPFTHTSKQTSIHTQKLHILA